MKKFKLLMTAGLLGGTISLVSCSEEKIINENTGGTGSITPEEMVDCTITASIKQLGTIETSRANWQNESYTWSAQDAFTLWERNLGTGYHFTVSPGYDGSQLSASAEFSGNMPVKDGHKLIAVYPYKEATAFKDFSTFSIPEISVQTGNAAELGTYSYMVATANVTEGRIPDLEFSPLTALLQFNLTNTSDKELKIYRITLESDEEVFPGELKITENGEVESVSTLRKNVTLDMGEQPVAAGATLSGYMNMIPTTYGDTRLMDGNNKLTLTVTVWNGTAEQDIVVLDKIAVKDMKDEIGLDMDQTAYQFAAGNRYKLNLDIDYRFHIPEEGYVIDNDGNIQIYNLDGLFNWREIAEDHPNVIVSLETTGEDNDSWSKTVDFSGREWTPLETFYGTFEGNGFTFENIKIANSGFTTINNGTIQNLNFKNVTFTDLQKATGVVSSSNTSKILNCHVDGFTMNGASGDNICYAGLVAENSGSAASIENCSVRNGSITSDNATAPWLAGLAGKNAQGVILNSLAENITIEAGSYSGETTRNVGGLVAHQDRGYIKACYSSTEITAGTPANLGGLVGVNASGHVRASYSTGNIAVTYSNGQWQSSAGLIGFNNGGRAVASYTTVTFEGTTAQTSVGGLVGRYGGSVNYTECYFTNTPKENEETIAGIQKITPENLAGKARNMNLAIQEAEPTLGYGFVRNTDPSTSSEQPLVISPWDGEIPGYEGPDFDEGGDI